MKSEDRLEMKDLIPNPILIKNKNGLKWIVEGCFLAKYQEDSY